MAQLVKESPETKMFKSYISQKFFNVCNSMGAQNDVNELWIDYSLYPFIFFISEIYETIKREKKFELVFTNTIKPEEYNFTNSNIFVLTSNCSSELKNIFSIMKQISDKAQIKKKSIKIFFFFINK